MLLLVKLTFRGPLKVGGGDLAQGEEFKGVLHSDTIFSAFCNEWVRINGHDSLESLIAEMKSDLPPFIISSAYPYYLSDYFLATPLGSDQDYMDKLNRVPFLELYDFLEIAAGNLEKVARKQLINPLDAIMFRSTVPRVSIDRVTAATNIFSTTGWRFKDGGGLYFLIDLQNESLKDKLVQCIGMLGDSGFGGDRSVGYGQFNVDIQQIDNAVGWSDLFKKWEGKNVMHYAMSLCLPSIEEAKNAVSYRLISRKGWIYSCSSIKQMKRRECKMFAEGSLFSKPARGVIADMTPSEFVSEHNVYRYGLCMNVDIRME